MFDWFRRAVLAALQVEYVGEDFDGEPEAEGTWAADGGPLSLVRCSLVADDLAGVRVVSKNGVSRVVIETGAHGVVSGSVVVAPAEARRFAAGVLNAADAADGTQPLMFIPGEVVR